MNHLKTGNAYFAQGSYKNNKYNGKELQETGMYSYGWREYMPDIGRWNGIDQLAESYLSTSPYAYVLNNPVNMYDPDGREAAFSAWFQSIWDATPGGTNSYWYNDGRGFTSYDENSKSGGGAASGLPWNSSVRYDGTFTMGDWTRVLPPVIVNGVGNASTWNLGNNYLPNILAMGMAFNKSLAGFNYQNGGGAKFDPMTWVRNDRGVMMIGGAGDPAGVFDIAGQVMSTWKPENRYLAMAAGIIGAVALKKPGLAAKEATGTYYSVAFEMKLAEGHWIFQICR